MPAPKTMFSLSSTKIYLLRAVVALCALLLSSFQYSTLWQYTVAQLARRDMTASPPGPMGPRRPAPISHWLPLVVIILILVHHSLMSLNMNFLYGLVDLVFLVLETIGFVIYNQPFTMLGQNEASCVVAIAARSTTFISLCLEAILRMQSLIKYIMQRHRDPSCEYKSLSDSLEEHLKWYQVIFGHSISGTHFINPMELSAQYYNSVSHMKSTLLARTILLRLILVSSFASLVLLTSVWQSLEETDYLWIGLLIFITLHHLFSCIHMEFNYGFADFPFLVFEIAFITPLIQDQGSIDPSSASPVICYKFFSWIILIGLALEALIWMVSISIYMTQPFKLQHSNTLDSTKLEFYKPHQVLFGHSLWKTYLSGEMRVTMASRGLVAATVLFMVLLYSVVTIILGPIQESGLTPTKDLRTLNLPSYLKTKNDTWNVVFITSTQGSGTTKDWDSVFHSAVIVKPLGNLNPGTPRTCPPIPRPSWSDHTEAITVYCGSDPVELLITVNFTTLQLPGGSRNSLKMMIGFTNNSDTVVQRTMGTTLLSGTNLVGEITSEIRQLIKKSSSSLFGLSDSYEAVRVAKMLNVYSDPQALVPGSLITYSRNISTFRVFMQDGPDVMETVLVQDYRSKSVLQGFSAVGGLWTFLSGIFAAIFGNSILRILFGFKSVSFSGLIHSLQRKEIRDACLQEYPRISEQMAQPNSEKGLLSLICDQLIDLDFLQVEKKADDTISPTNEPTN